MTDFRGEEQLNHLTARDTLNRIHSQAIAAGLPKNELSTLNGHVKDAHTHLKGIGTGENVRHHADELGWSLQGVEHTLVVAGQENPEHNTLADHARDLRHSSWAAWK
jgi:hypothetical protein